MKRSVNFQRANVVGAIHSPKSLEAALNLAPGTVDILELRTDAFTHPERLLEAAPDLKFPLLITARHPLEGGQHHLGLARRRELFEAFLPFASLIDIELRSIEKLQSLAGKARQQGVKLVLSYHNFQSTPSGTRLHELARRALLSGGDIFKVAVETTAPADLAVLLTFLAKQKRIHLSVMGMGRFGKISRLLFAQAGSVLNYGFLDRATVPGQWPATLLKTRLAEFGGK